MKNRISLLVLAIIGCVLPLFAQANNDNQDGVFRAENGTPLYKEGEIIVKFKDSENISVRCNANGRFMSVSNSALHKILGSVGTYEMEQLMPLSGRISYASTRRAVLNKYQESDLSQLYLIRYDKEDTGLSELISSLKNIDCIEYAEPNYIYSIVGTSESLEVNDPLYSEQHGIQSIDLPSLWSLEKIDNHKPVIAILDTGVDINHPDLSDNIWTNEIEAQNASGVDDDQNGYFDDLHGFDFVENRPIISSNTDKNGHGTHCAGIAAAVGNNEIGIIGANPDALIMPVKVMHDNGLGDEATIIRGLDYAIANNANIISMSIGGYKHSEIYRQALLKAYNKGIIIVASAGNDGYPVSVKPCFPAAYDFVVGVMAHNASFSNYDDRETIYSNIGRDTYRYEVGAPGNGVISTFPGGEYKILNGTSMAAPYVAGAISRLLQVKGFDYGKSYDFFGDLLMSHNANGMFNAYSMSQWTDENRDILLDVCSVTIDDSKYGDGDGVIDAGETVELYPTVKNLWGIAQNIQIHCDIKDLVHTSDNLVEIMSNDISLGYNLTSSGQATAKSPIIVKISDTIEDGYNLQLGFSASCDDMNQDMVHEQVLSYHIVNGIEIKGMITHDMTLYPNKRYIITGKTIIPEGVTVTVMPGTNLIFGGDLMCTYTRKSTAIGIEGGRIDNYEVDRVKSGRLIMHGTPDSLIVVTTKPNSNSQYKLSINNSEAFRTTQYISQGIVTSSSTEWMYEGLEYDALRYVEFRGKEQSCVKVEGGILENCLFHENGRSQIGSPKYMVRTSIINNPFRGNDVTSSMRGIYLTLANNDYIGQMDLSAFEQCNILPLKNEPYYLLCGGNSLIRKIAPSYFGSSDEEKVHSRIYDIENDCSSYYVDLSNMLLQPVSEAHGLVWKVVVNGYDAQDEVENLSPLGIGKQKFEVHFNRPMDVSIMPKVTMGLTSPYTQIEINEDPAWSADSLVYTCYLDLNGKLNSDGLNTIKVSGAYDNEHFPIPVECERFKVMVQKAGSMATGLIAEAGLGKVNLTWDTEEEDFADMMGYNVYRYTVNDKGEQSAEKKLNENLVESEETTYTDFDVVPGTTYYYIVKEMGTDLQEHIVSNPVAATPLTAQKGDANGSMTVDVADVVTEVNYLTNQNPQPFIFEAADVNNDNAVNILDVVGTVNLIFRPDAVGTESVENTATYFVNDGILYVDTPTPLGGAQVSIAAPQGTEFEALEGLSGMEQASFWQNDNAYILLAYSMSGKYIPMGVQPFLRVGDAEVTDMVLSDTRGHNVLAINGAVTSINALPFGFENYAGAEVRYYDLTGRAISRTQAQQQGVHIQSIFVGGKCMKSYKVLK